MKKAGLNFIGIIMLAVLVTACGSNKTKEEDTQNRATVEERGTSGGQDDADAGAVVTQGLDDRARYDAAALNDPASPLAVRIIYFDYDSANIRADFADTVAAHAAFLADNPSASVTLEGHADERGSREYNLALGERRALAVRRQLVLLGASAGQVTAVSYGEERPLADGHDEQSYSENRRVELVY